MDVDKLEINLGEWNPFLRRGRCVKGLEAGVVKKVIPEKSYSHCWRTIEVDHFFQLYMKKVIPQKKVIPICP